jgi:segregation and condensation protein A
MQILLEQFKGPLDLLLQLIEKDKLQITEISLAKVTDQYLDFIDQAEHIASEEVADFLLIAAKLIYLKSKHLLPDFDMADEEDAASLEDQLKIYRQYYDASKVVHKIFVNTGKYSYGRTAPFKKFMPEGFVAPKNLATADMKNWFKEILQKIDRVVNLPKMAIVKAVSIGEKIKHIKNKIKQSGKLNFWHLVKDKKNKMEAVISFLAMLELVKQREIAVEQDKLFGNLNINSNKEIEF